MKNKKIIFFISIILTLFNFSYSQNSTFGMILKPFEEICLSEYYKSQTVIIFELNSESPNILLEVKSPKGTILFHQKNTTSLFPLTTEINGFFSVCTKNMANMDGEVKLTIKSGISANDFSSVAKSKDLEPIDYALEQIFQRQPMINHYNRIIIEKQNQFSSFYRAISNRIFFYSFIMIVLMIIIGIIETFYLRRFMERRKII